MPNCLFCAQQCRNHKFFDGVCIPFPNLKIKCVCCVLPPFLNSTKTTNKNYLITNINTINFTTNIHNLNSTTISTSNLSANFTKA